MKNTIIQWNCLTLLLSSVIIAFELIFYFYLRANYNELKLLLMFMILEESDHVTFTHYNLFNTSAVGDGRGNGGVNIIINNKKPSSQIQ